MSNPDLRWQQRFQSYGKALARLAEAVRLAGERELNDLEQQGLIQAFEFTHELAWNVLKDYLEEQGVFGIIGSKGATREAFKSGLIDAGEVWMEMIVSRNQTSHTYNEETADQITEAILSRYADAFEKLRRRLAELEAQQP